jgi:hypothetical protein
MLPYRVGRGVVDATGRSSVYGSVPTRSLACCFYRPHEGAVDGGAIGGLPMQTRRLLPLSWQLCRFVTFATAGGALEPGVHSLTEAPSAGQGSLCEPSIYLIYATDLVAAGGGVGTRSLTEAPSAATRRTTASATSPGARTLADGGAVGSHSPDHYLGHIAGCTHAR